jgi:exosortase
MASKPQKGFFKTGIDQIYLERPLPATAAAVKSHLNTHRFPYILLGLLILLNIPIIWGLIQDWFRDDNYSHGFLIIPISIYLFYRKRKELKFPASTSRTGFIFFVLGCIGLLFGVAASEFFSTRFSLILTITGLSLYYLGNENFHKVWFAFFFLLFMIPIPAVIYYSATMPMQLFASKATSGVLHLMGVPSARDGNIIYLPAYTLEIVEACSGLRSLVTLLALAALMGHLTLPGKIRPIILFMLAVPVAIIVNIIRLVFTAVGAYAISPKLAEDFLHEVSGILVFAVALLLMIAIAGLLRWKRNPS